MATAALGPDSPDISPPGGPRGGAGSQARQLLSKAGSGTGVWVPESLAWPGQGRKGLHVLGQSPGLRQGSQPEGREGPLCAQPSPLISGGGVESQRAGQALTGRLPAGRGQRVTPPWPLVEK